jgi:hypothetical protein
MTKQEIELHEDITYLLLSIKNHPPAGIEIPAIAENLIKKCQRPLLDKIEELKK